MKLKVYRKKKKNFSAQGLGKGLVFCFKSRASNMLSLIKIIMPQLDFTQVFKTNWEAG